MSDKSSLIVVPFVPKATGDTETNILAYIDHIKLTARYFQGREAINWADDTWDLTPFFPVRGGIKTKAIFRPAPNSDESFSLQFNEQIKALMADYLQKNRTRQVSRVMGVFRCLALAMERSAVEQSIANLNSNILDVTIEIMREKYTSLYPFGQILQCIVQTQLDPLRLCAVELNWKSPFKWVAPNRSNLVKKREKIPESNRKKLPELKCIFDLAGVFHASENDADTVVTSWFALSMLAPSRVNEILTLPLKCLTSAEGAEGSVEGISWRPLKGGMPLTKFAVSEDSADLAKKAVKRLEKLGAQARVAASWYETNPSQLYLPDEMEHLRGKPVTLYEVGKIIGRSSPVPVRNVPAFGFAGTNKYTGDPSRTGGKGIRKLYTFESVQNYVLNKLPDGFPLFDEVSDLKFSEALFCMPAEVMRGYAGTFQNIPQRITQNIITHELGKKPTGQTIFARHNLTNPETDAPWKLATHQPRHLLSTLAESRHVSQELIAFWSGRKSVAHNEWYNHLSQEFYIEAYVALEDKAPKQLKVTGPLEKKVQQRSRNELISDDELLRQEIGAMHITSFGYCRHDFALTPCPKDRWCSNCGEAYFAKGHAQQIDATKRAISALEVAVKKAEAAVDDGLYGASQWLEQHRYDLERHALKLSMLTDPETEDGTLLTLPPPVNSQSKTGLSLNLANERRD